jgi:hypothetical protein
MEFGGLAELRSTTVSSWPIGNDNWVVAVPLLSSVGTLLHRVLLAPSWR